MQTRNVLLWGLISTLFILHHHFTDDEAHKKNDIGSTPQKHPDEKTKEAEKAKDNEKEKEMEKERESVREKDRAKAELTNIKG